MLSKRLQVASNYIDPNLNFADIGCDHGYLAIDAINKGVKIVQLVDNKIGPLNIAKNNLEQYLNDSEVIFTLGDGLKLLDSRINIVAICGMGGDLISKILADSILTAKKLDYLILEANSKVDNLRKYLNSEDFEILDEDFVIDRNKKYVVMKTKYSPNYKKITDLEIEFGPILLTKMPLEYKNELLNQKSYLESLLLKTNDNNDNLIKKKYEMIKEILNETI